jgi:prepilin-type N-terminal cleavage/methylation domain-containing protein
MGASRSRTNPRPHVKLAPRKRARSVRRGARRAFTLIETAMAVVIIGVGVVAMVDAQQAFMKSNAWSSQAATATFLANEIREYTRRLPRHDPVTGLELDEDELVGWGPEEGEVTHDDYDDIDDFDGVRFGDGGDFSGPINASGGLIPRLDADGNPVIIDEEIQPMSGWSQQVTVEKVNPFDLAEVLDDDAVDAASGDFEGRGPDDFPVRVTVTVFYQGPEDEEAAAVLTMRWIVPAN